jgi:small-conductance mechanosensitive channel
LSAVIIFLIADLVWHATKAAIDRKLAENADLGPPNTDEARRRARLRTLLPIFRNILFVVVIAVAALMVLAAMGVEIGPLVAGLSVLGVAIGFGAQNFIRDIIAGMFLSALLALRDWRRAWTEAVWRGVCLSPWMVI